ncbi:universal stress protein [Dyella sp.]|uniref:universal stress protein n=1 Tax=Dyella sp. TaxID=1869338 RepID=UPI002ED6570A
MYDLIVHVEDIRDDASVVQLGLPLAHRLGAYATGLHVIDIVPASLALPDVAAVLARVEIEAEQRTDWWMGLCRQHHVDGCWEVARGPYASALAHRSCLADLTISTLPSLNTGYSLGFDYLTQVLLSGASPMLLIPADSVPVPDYRHIIVAWNGSLEAVRALRAALPFLRRATVVTVVDGSTEPLPGLSPARLPLREWLKREGVDALIIRTVEMSRETIGPTLLDAAVDAHADLLVMGAWGHSRFSEWILGGSTRYILQRATLPVLMAH